MTTILARTPARLLIAMLFAVTSIGIGAQGAHAAISTQMDFGSRGTDVTQLQTYLATDSNLYPSGLITGYFGALTQAAVQRFQTAQGIVSSGTPSTTGYGRVGPATMARLNSLMGAGGQATGDTVPILSNPVSQAGNTTATITWTTNEPTQGQVYWDTTSIRADEATGPGQRPYISGTLAADGSMQTNHMVTLSNLQPNTTYYYLIRAIDGSGDYSITWPPGSFRTTP